MPHARKKIKKTWLWVSNKDIELCLCINLFHSQIRLISLEPAWSFNIYDNLIIFVKKFSILTKCIRQHIIKSAVVNFQREREKYIYQEAASQFQNFQRVNTCTSHLQGLKLVVLTMIKTDVKPIANPAFIRRK